MTELYYGPVRWEGSWPTHLAPLGQQLDSAMYRVRRAEARVDAYKAENDVLREWLDEHGFDVDWILGQPR